MVAEAWPQLRRFTPEEYLEIERKATFKSDYLNGQIYAMAGGDPKHSAVAANVITALSMQLWDRPCQVFTSDLKVRTTPGGLFAYPDASVVCGDLEFHDNREDVVTNPVILVEVLSPSTAAYDRLVKFDQYRQIPNLARLSARRTDRAQN
jgi:Uma2 family endonuclease